MQKMFFAIFPNKSKFHSHVQIQDPSDIFSAKMALFSKLFVLCHHKHIGMCLKQLEISLRSSHIHPYSKPFINGSCVTIHQDIYDADLKN